ncbi:MAG: GNAT family N-acetyltransferase [Gemmatimonadaceae bacterium]
MSSAVRVVPASASHVDAYLALEFEIAWAYRRFVFGDSGTAAAIQRRLFENQASEFAPPHALIALVGDELAGMYAALSGVELRQRRMKEALTVARAAVGQADSGFAARSRLAARVMLPVADDAFYLSRIAVTERYRGRSIGRQLVDHVLAAGTSLGLRSCSLDVEPSNQAALRLYRAAGFSEEKISAVVDPDTGRELSYARLVRSLA